MKCVNCKKEIKKKDTTCYSRDVCEFFCSLDCFTDFAHEYLGCVPITDELLKELKTEHK